MYSRFIPVWEETSIPVYPDLVIREFIFLGPNPKGWGLYRFGVSVRLFVIDSFPGCIFVTNGRSDLGIYSYERSWPVDVPCDSFGQNRPPEMTEFGQNVKKTAVFRNMSF